jgi:arginyl-tRNA synthetase
MKFIIDKDIAKNYPYLRIGIIVAHDIDNSGENTQLNEIKINNANQIRSLYTSRDLIKNQFIKAWRETYRSFGVRPKSAQPTAEALIRRILRGHEIPTISKAVDLYLIAETEYFLPIGGYDLNSVNGNIFLRYSTGNEKFVPLNDPEKTESPSSSEIVYADETRVLTRRWNWRDCDYCKITKNSKNIALFTEIADESLKTEHLIDSLGRISSLILKYCGGRVTALVADVNKGFEWPVTELIISTGALSETESIHIQKRSYEKEKKEEPIYKQEIIKPEIKQESFFSDYYSTNSVKGILERSIEESLMKIDNDGDIKLDNLLFPSVTAAPSNFGDYSTTVALKIGSAKKIKATEVAELIVSNIPNKDLISSINIVDPGFINFKLDKHYLTSKINEIISENKSFGSCKIGKSKKVQVEFVSANPTGPLHVGHGRNAAIGNCIARVMEYVGYNVSREFYINDAIEGGQVQSFGETLYNRYRELCNIPYEETSSQYLGEYMLEIARDIVTQHGEKYINMDKSTCIREFASIGISKMLENIKQDCHLLGVHFDSWYSEQTLFDEKLIESAVKYLLRKKLAFKKDDAVWFRSSLFEDDKDRVIIRNNGKPTYFGSDISYHYTKFVKRRFYRVINVWGADHHGYIPRMRSAISAMNVAPNRLSIVLTQLVNLMRGNIVVRMSKRSGNYVSLRDVIDEVGADVAKFIFLSRSPNTELDFDIEIAKKQSDENPAYYIQYAHTRLAGILRAASEKCIDFSEADTSLIEEEEALDIVRHLVRFPEIVETSARDLSPQTLIEYGLTLAAKVHKVYKNFRIVKHGDQNITDGVVKARLKFTLAAKIVLANCLYLIGIDAPERM